MKASVNRILQEQESQYATRVEHRAVDFYGHEEWVGLQAQLKGLWLADLSYVETGHSLVEVKWTAELDERSWGIKDIDISVMDVTINATFNVLDENDESVEFEFYIDSVASEKWEIEIEEGPKNVPLAPNNVIIHLKEKKVVVNF
jgi:hypothetical protein